jgi:uncharacterized coiled-coil protein SlyX
MRKSALQAVTIRALRYELREAQRRIAEQEVEIAALRARLPEERAKVPRRRGAIGDGALFARPGRSQQR